MSSGPYGPIFFLFIGLYYLPIRKIEISKKIKDLPDTIGKISVFGVIKDDCKNSTETEEMNLF